MSRLLRITVTWLLIVAAAAYICDWAIFKLRGSPTEKIMVSLFVSAPLKNNKQELDFIGQEQWNCTKTLFPLPPYSQEQSTPCWYLRQHTNQVTTY